MSKQARLEALKLASGLGLAPDETVQAADVYFRYIEDGGVVVESAVADNVVVDTPRRRGRPRREEFIDAGKLKGNEYS
jgi:hypothetical protein